MRGLFAFTGAVLAVSVGASQGPALSSGASARAPAAATSEPAAGSRPASVRVDATAVDSRGRLVETLTPADFELTENGVLQALDSVRLIKVDPQAPDDAPPIRSEFDEQEQAGRESTRLFAFFLDEFHVTAGASTMRVREALTQFVDRALGPRDLVAVLKPLDSLLTIRLTRDRDAIRQAIQTFEGRRGLYEPRTPFERNFIAGDSARVEQVRTQVATSALNALVVHLGMLNDGRKTVVFVTEGLTRQTRRRGFETLPTADTVIRSANRYNVSIYPVDPREPDPVKDVKDVKDVSAVKSDPGEAARSAPDVDMLRALADSTDGRAILTTRGFDAGLQQIAADASAYYLLSYRSAHADDGTFRDVQVRVKRAGVTVRARKGYWALWPDEALATQMLARALAPASAAPAPVATAWRISPLIRPWFGVARGEGGRTRVTFVWEPAPRVPGVQSRRGQPSRVELKVLGSDGNPVFEGAVLASSGSCSTAGEGTSQPCQAVFEVPPGRLRLRMSIEDAGAQVIDTDARELAIRDLRGPVALGTAEIVRTRNAREYRAVDGDPDAVPSASREFSRTERLVVRVRAYAPNGAPKVSAKLMSRMGQVMRELPARPAPSSATYQFDLPLAGLAPGEYLLELSASSPAGEAKDLIGFRVTN